jgi:transcriptional regulator with GAF, ATPase, and Fis domain
MRLHRAIRVSEILRVNSAYKRRIQTESSDANLVGCSEAFHKVMRLVEEAALSRATVLITGETGTGKGLIARAIHEQSRERDQPYQVIDCATLPEGMVESELFGHVRGAFTGAIADKPGLIELANGGTVFLDEIGELSLALQTKLLRVLDENEVRRVGGTRVKRVETRFIAATNQDLQEKIRAGTFRKDLYYRLAVVAIHVPPLRERREDIPTIARFLCARIGREMGKPRCFLDVTALEALTINAWPGNARELRNVIERAVMFATEERITRESIMDLMMPAKRADTSTEFIDVSLPYHQAKLNLLAKFNSIYLQAKLAATDGRISKAAEASGIHPNYFSHLLKRHLQDKRSTPS